MKFTFRPVLVLLILIVIVYAGCMKNSTGPSPVTSATKTIAANVASTLYKGLTGSLGGINLSNGISVPAGFGTLLCGASIDSAINANSSKDTLTSHVTGRLKFSFLCTGGQPYGFMVFDTLANIGTTPHTSFSYIFSENLVVTAANTKATVLAANGNLKSFGDIHYNDPRIGTVSEHDSFVLTGLTIDLANNFDLPTGSATFSTVGINTNGNWNYSGTIAFVGNHMIKMTINGTTFNVNLLTGVVTP